jgi:hypothetical protein
MGYLGNDGTLEPWERPPGTHYSSIPIFQHSNLHGLCKTKPIGGQRARNAECGVKNGRAILQNKANLSGRGDGAQNKPNSGAALGGTNKANLQGPGIGGQEGDGGSCETKPICLGRKTDPAEPGRTMVPGFPLPDRVEDKLRGNDMSGYCAKQTQFRTGPPVPNKANCVGRGPWDCGMRIEEQASGSAKQSQFDAPGER